MLPINKFEIFGKYVILLPIFKELGFKIGELNHYFALNPNISNFSLIKAPKNLLNSLKSSSKNIQSKKLKLINTKFQLDVFGKDITKSSIAYS